MIGLLTVQFESLNYRLYFFIYLLFKGHDVLLLVIQGFFS